MLDALAVLATLAVWALGARVTWLAFFDRPITPRTLVGLPRRKPSALAKTVDDLRDEHSRAHGIGSF